MATVVTARPVSLDRARARAGWLHGGLTLATFAGVYLVLLSVLHLDLIFSRTTAAGGDMGSHHYVAEFLRTELLPKGRVSGWAPGWYAGIPMLTFYFPLTYSLMALLSPLLGPQVAFKLVTASGLFLLPLTSWAAFRVMRLPRPAPLLAAVAAVPFLFMTSYTIYGGNIASTMAGEFTFAFSFALLPLAFAVCWRAVDDPDGRWWRRAALLVTAVVLSHILTTIVLVLGVLVLLVRPSLAGVRQALWRLVKIFSVAFCLSAFWAVPFVARVGYTAHFRWTQLTDLYVLAPVEIRAYLVLTIVGLVTAAMVGERRIVLFAWTVVACVGAFLVLAAVLPKASLWNARLLPFIYLYSLLIAAYGAATAGRWLVGVARRALVPAHGGVVGAAALVLVVALAAGGTGYAVFAHRGFLPYWAKYNYEGFEAKRGWPEARALFAMLDKLPQGRVMWEYNNGKPADGDPNSGGYERFGTTRTLENIPVFTRQDSMEGLLIESSLNAPFHFVNQAETSPESTQAVPGLDYPGFDFASGLTHLREFGVRYYLAYTPKARQAAERAGLRRVASTGIRTPNHDGGTDEFVAYEVGDGHLVEVPAHRPVLYPTSDWRETSLAWYRNPAWQSTPLAYADADDPAARRAFAALPGGRPAGQGVSALPSQPLAGAGPVTGARWDGPERLTFHTDRVGVPHVVKVSWFPNWKATGADGPWMLSPGLMVVVPNSPDVTLVYQDTWAEILGKILTLAGILVLLGSVLVKRWGASGNRGMSLRLSLGRRTG